MKKEVRKYRPSNGSEGMWFSERFCFRCKAENICKILSAALCYDTSDEKYPKQWIVNEDGKPVCTSFHDKNERRKRHEKKDKNQGELFK
jgi:hypothetical protein